MGSSNMFIDEVPIENWIDVFFPLYFRMFVSPGDVDGENFTPLAGHTQRKVEVQRAGGSS